MQLFLCHYFRRQKSTSWPRCRTCCDSACSHRPSCSRSANCSLLSTTSCPERPSPMSFRYRREWNNASVYRFNNEQSLSDFSWIFNVFNFKYVLHTWLEFHYFMYLNKDFQPLSDNEKDGDQYSPSIDIKLIFIWLTLFECLFFVFFFDKYYRRCYICLVLLVFQTLSDLDPSLTYITDMASKVNSIIPNSLV